MLKRAWELRDVILSLPDISKEYATLMMAEEEWKMVDILLNVLQPFNDVTTAISTSLEPSIHEDRPRSRVAESNAYTPAQNGAAERAGGVIMRKARAMRIEAQMPESLWPKFFKAAIYITNRTPTKPLGWLTPIETLHQELNRPNPRPTGAHLHILGSRAYVLINKIPKKAKFNTAPSRDI